MKQTERERPLVLFSITNGWGVRNFLHTGLFEAVIRFADVGVAVSDELEPFFQELRQQGKITLVIKLPAHEKPFWRWIRQAKKAILQANRNISTARIKWQENAQGAVARRLRNVTWHMQQCFAARWQIRLLENLEYYFAAEGIGLPEKRPQLMVNCSPFHFRDNWLMRALQRENIPTMAIVPSWDNPSTKGCILTRASVVLVWGEHQKRELLGYYPWLKAKHVRVSGIPQFDGYYEPLGEKFDREQFLGRLSIAATAKVILYATCSERLFPNEPGVVADVVTALNQGHFGREAHLLIRCHPADRAVRYEPFLESGRVTIFPSSLSDKQDLSNWTPPKNELAILTATLRHCEVCINTASTMTLDALASGKPVVNVAYDGNTELDYLRSVRRYYDYHHYAPIVASGAVPLAHTAGELVRLVQDALVQPEQTYRQRASVVEAFCAHPPEGSVGFISNEIQNLIRCER